MSAAWCTGRGWTQGCSISCTFWPVIPPGGLVWSPGFLPHTIYQLPDLQFSVLWHHGQQRLTCGQGKHREWTHYKSWAKAVEIHSRQPFFYQFPFSAFVFHLIDRCWHRCTNSVHWKRWLIPRWHHLTCPVSSGHWKANVNRTVNIFSRHDAHTHSPNILEPESTGYWVWGQS